MKFSIKEFFSKCDQCCRKLRIWSNLLKKSLMENFIFVQCCFSNDFVIFLLLSSLKRGIISSENLLFYWDMLLYNFRKCFEENDIVLVDIVRVYLSRIFERTDSLVPRIFQRFDLCDGTHLLELQCGSRKLTEPIKNFWTLLECDYVILLTQHKTCI